MIGEVKTAFKQRLETDDWLDNTTKTRCVEKVNAITQMVAYPDQIENSTYLDELYAEVSRCSLELYACVWVWSACRWRM